MDDISGYFFKQNNDQTQLITTPTKTELFLNASSLLLNQTARFSDHLKQPKEEQNKTSHLLFTANNLK